MDTIQERGEALRRYIKSRGMTQKEAAEIVGISAPHMANILNGRDGMGQKKVRKIVAAFPELSEAYLLTGQGELTPGIHIQQHHNNNAGDVAVHIGGDASLRQQVADLQAQLDREREEKARLLGIIEKTIATK